MSSKGTESTASEYNLFTDGSGYKDGYGGWACLVQVTESGTQYFRMGAVIGCTVDRMELTAILEGLQVIFEIMPLRKGSIADQAKTSRPIVHLFTDRENLALSIMRVYDRSNSRDLWERFSYYEGFMKVVAFHVERETEYPQFVKVDLHASTGRIIAKNYAAITDLPDHLVDPEVM